MRSMMLLPVLFVLLIPFLALFFVVGSFVWHHLNTRGMAYFGRPQAARARFRKRLAGGHYPLDRFYPDVGG